MAKSRKVVKSTGTKEGIQFERVVERMLNMPPKPHKFGTKGGEKEASSKPRRWSKADRAFLGDPTSPPIGQTLPFDLLVGDGRAFPVL
ncbi:MAG: hypothetical protein O7A64_01895 [Alphaproteobacteria bacterium]|nr:hypothetical protein [Alphaproteobacteria bacterium]